MAKEAPCKIYKSSQSRSFIYLRNDLVTDSGFPFKIKDTDKGQKGDKLVAKIVGNKIVISKAKN